SQPLDVERRGKIRAEGQFLIDFVADEPQIVPAADFADRLDLGAREHRAAWIVRAVEEQDAATGHNGGFKVLRPQMEAIGYAQRNRNELGTRTAHQTFISGVVGV